MKETTVEIGGHRYRYHYDPDTQKTVYDGPVGSAPELSEAEFLKAITDTYEFTEIKTAHKGVRDIYWEDLSDVEKELLKGSPHPMVYDKEAMTSYLKIENEYLDTGSDTYYIYDQKQDLDIKADSLDEAVRKWMITGYSINPNHVVGESGKSSVKRKWTLSGWDGLREFQKNRGKGNWNLLFSVSSEKMY